MDERIALVVDDDPDIRAMVSIKLRAAGYEVHEEADGEGGLAAIRELAPSVVLLDWMMPRMNGLEVLQHVRSDPSIATTPVILLTARAQEDAVERGFAAGADDYVIKPFSPRELMSRVEGIQARMARTAERDPVPVGTSNAAAAQGS